MPVEIIEPGLATSIQDLGRQGFYNVGIPPSGAVDRYAAIAANILVGNGPVEAVFESTYMGPKLCFTEPSVVAVTGAQAPVFINGTAAPSWESLQVAAGDVLSFGIFTGGARIYIAVAGGLNVPIVLGSRSHYALGAIGGFEGRNLLAGDSIPIGQLAGTPGRAVPEDMRPVHSREVDVRIVLGLYDFRLSENGLSALIDKPWQLTTVADRIGFRYAGNTLEWVPREQPFGAGSDPSNITDAPYPVGSIQVPAGTEPIILHRDAVSGGGYAQVGTVISADMDLVGQSSPGTKTRFRPVSIDEALDARKKYMDRQRKLIQLW